MTQLINYIVITLPDNSHQLFKFIGNWRSFWHWNWMSNIGWCNPRITNHHLLFAIFSCRGIHRILYIGRTKHSPASSYSTFAREIMNIPFVVFSNLFLRRKRIYLLPHPVVINISTIMPSDGLLTSIRQGSRYRKHQRRLPRCSRNARRGVRNIYHKDIVFGNLSVS